MLQRKGVSGALLDEVWTLAVKLKFPHVAATSVGCLKLRLTVLAENRIRGPAAGLCEVSVERRRVLEVTATSYAVDFAQGSPAAVAALTVGLASTYIAPAFSCGCVSAWSARRVYSFWFVILLLIWHESASVSGCHQTVRRYTESGKPGLSRPPDVDTGGYPTRRRKLFPFCSSPAW